MKKAILWIMCITCLLLVILSFVLREKCSETVCDIMRFSGFILLLVFSIVRSVWRNDIQNPPSANKSGQ